MRKYILIAVIAVVALLPVAAWADTGGTAEATLTFDAVINMIVDGSAWLDLTIDQPMIAEWALAGLTGPIDWDDGGDDVTVTVQSFTAFAVYSSYFATSTTLTLPGDLGDQDAFLYLDSFALQWEQVTASTGPFDYASPPMPGTGDLTKLWEGGATMWTSPYEEERSYNVQWDPTQLSGGDLNAGDGMDVTIYFVVTDTST